MDPIMQKLIALSNLAAVQQAPAPDLVSPDVMMADTEARPQGGGAFTLPNYGFGPMTPASRAGRMPSELRNADPYSSVRPLSERITRALLDYGPMPAKAATSPAAAASAIDPFNIPSAAVGLVSPEARDEWRRVQSTDALGNVAGQLLSGGGAANALLKSTQSIPALLAAGSAMGAGSDMIDAAGGKDDALTTQTAIKAVLGGAGMAPTKATIAAAAGGTGALLAGEAEAQQRKKGGDSGQAPQAPDGLSSQQQQRWVDLNKELNRDGSLPGVKRRELDGLNQISAEHAKAMNSAKGKASEIEATAAADRAAKEAEIAMRDRVAKDRANTPIKTLYPDATLAAQAGLGGLGLLMSALVKRGNVGRYNAEVEAAARSAGKAASGADRALASGVPDKAVKLTAEAEAAQSFLNKLKSQGPSNKGTALPTIGGLEAAFVGPQIVDRYGRAEPGSPLYEKSDPFKNLDETAKRMAGAAATGYLASKGVSAGVGGVMQKAAPMGAQGQIDALTDALSGQGLKQIKEASKYIRASDSAAGGFAESRLLDAGTRQRRALELEHELEALRRVDPQDLTPAATRALSERLFPEGAAALSPPRALNQLPSSASFESPLPPLSQSLAASPQSATSQALQQEPIKQKFVAGQRPQMPEKTVHALKNDDAIHEAVAMWREANPNRVLLGPAVKSIAESIGVQVSDAQARRLATRLKELYPTDKARKVIESEHRAGEFMLRGAKTAMED